jgi:succinate dehydrogenase / fumarate reductase, cytochrome b subunit
MPFLKFLRSTLGLKIIMGATGVLLFAFIVGHMLGNLQIFIGRDAINGYASFLKSKPELLWPVRIGLLIVVLLHIASAIVLTLRNRAARPIGYNEPKTVGATWASRTMMISGSIVLVFIVFHLLHFTVGFIKPEYFALEENGRHDVYGMMIRGFQVPWISAFYIVSVGLLCFHLSHGLSSMFRSLGLTEPAWQRPQELFAVTFAAIIFAGMSIIPTAVLMGFINLPG